MCKVANLSLVVLVLSLVGLINGIVYRSLDSAEFDKSERSRENEIGGSSETPLRDPYSMSYLERGGAGESLLMDRNQMEHDNFLSEDMYPEDEDKRVKEQKRQNWEGWNYLDTSKGKCGHTLKIFMRI